MDIDRNSLAKNYTTKSDNELLNLHSAGTLTDEAYEILEAELKGREVVIPQRRKEPTVPRGRPETLKAHWNGRASLVSAYWIIGVLGGLIFYVLFKVVGSSPVGDLIFLLWIPYIIFALVSIWRCAWNTNWKGWGYIARAVVLLSAVRVFMIVFLRVVGAPIP